MRKQLLTGTNSISARNECPFAPMRRAQETAECIAAVTGLAVQADARLRERLNWDGSTPWEALRGPVCPHG
jgi:broad specificity phosphatase PhoE